MFVGEIAKLAGPLAMQVEDAFETMPDDLTGAILFLLDLGEDEVLGIQLRIQWASKFSESLMKAMSSNNAPLPNDLATRKEEIARRKAKMEAGLIKSAPRLTSLVEPILELARSQAEAQLPSPALLDSEHPAPEPLRYGVSSRGAELWVADALLWLGIEGVNVTQLSADGGVDILTDDFAVSVKHYTGSVPVEEVREIFGVATVMQKTPMLWTSGTLTLSGDEFAAVAPVAVFHYEVETASITARNQAAQDLVDVGFRIDPDL
jgi:hypothetical protein